MASDDDQSELTAPGESARARRTFGARRLGENLLGHYLLLDELGRGGMGVVYAAHDSKLGRKVAIKMLRAEGNAKLQSRLIREAKAMAKLAHPNVVSVHEIGEHEGSAFIVMEYVEGTTLRQWLTAASRSMAEIVTAFTAAGRGLAAIHAAGLVHRDFKPDNLMIRDSGQVLVMDLGIAREHHRGHDLSRVVELDTSDDAPVDLTRTGALMGSPAYMAAEQFSGREITAKTDQFSFCVSLWEALYGERPFAGSNLVTLMDAVTTGKTRAAKHREVPAALRTVLERGLRVEPADRFESMTALLDALDRALSSGARVRTRLTWGAGLVAAFALVVVGGPAWLGEAASSDVVTPSEVPAVEQVAVPVPESEASGHRQITATGTATLPALSPDGESLVYVGNEGFVHVDMRSGETRKLAPTVSSIFVSSLANDGSMMFSGMLLEKYGVYRMPSLDAVPVPISGVLPIFCRFRDRDQIASMKLPGKLVRVTDAKGELVAEVPVEGEYEWLREVACDPRNNRVVVLHSLGKTNTLKLLDLDGGPARVLYESSVELSSPSFDQTGDTLYYLAKHDGQTNLEATRVAVNGDDLPVTRVVVQDIDAETFARADSGRIVHVRTHTINHGIWRLGAGSSSLDDAERVMETNAEEVFIAVSPDETQLAYVESRRNLGRLMIRALSGGAEREVTRGDRLRHVAWSPDGQTLTFIAQYRGQAHVWTVPAAGGTPTVLKRTFASDGPPLAWAPSEWIIYERPENRNFGVLDPNTENDRPLIADQTVGWPFNPVVSPDGESVAVFWNRERRGVWAIDIDDGTERLLAEGQYFPMTWSTDGRFVYVVADDESPVKIQRISASGGPVELWRTVDFGPRRNAVCQVLSSPPTSRTTPDSNEELLCAVLETASDIWMAEGIE